MTAKPDPEAIRRAAAKLRHDHQPRQLQHEPRLSVADEQQITDRVHYRETTDKQAARTKLAENTHDLTKRVQSLRDTMHTGTTTTRGERNLARRIAHDLDVLTDMLNGTSDLGVHSSGRV